MEDLKARQCKTTSLLRSVAPKLRIYSLDSSFIVLSEAAALLSSFRMAFSLAGWSGYDELDT